jgi:hypothetical protein
MERIRLAARSGLEAIRRASIRFAMSGFVVQNQVEIRRESCKRSRSLELLRSTINGASISNSMLLE